MCSYSISLPQTDRKILLLALKARMLSEQTAPQPFESIRTRTSLPGKLGVRQSAYRPLSRPAPRLSQVTPPRQSEFSGITLWGPMAQKVPRHLLYTEDDAKPSTQAPTTSSPIPEEKIEGRPCVCVCDRHYSSTEYIVYPLAAGKEAEKPTVSKKAGASKAEGPSEIDKTSQFLSPTRPRSKSSVRRRPRQHRRSTGIPYEVCSLRAPHTGHGEGGHCIV